MRSTNDLSPPHLCRSYFVFTPVDAVAALLDNHSHVLFIKPIINKTCKIMKHKMAADFEIIVGTYEQFLLGYKVTTVDDVYNLERSFATHSHLASIRSVASSKHYLASAAADDLICLYDMRYRIESGRLMHHSDTVNCINFTPEASHIMTASNDGSIGIVRCGNWELEKHWKSPHKGSAVNALAIHPSGKLAMSTGGDGVLRTWNLVKGRQAYATNLVPRLRNDAKNVTILRWSPNGDKYLLASNCKLDIYSVETAGLCAEMSFDSKIVCVEFIDDDLLAIGYEDGIIRFCDIATGSTISIVEAHETRVKCLVGRNNYLVSASSSGEVKLWDWRKKKLNVLAVANCGARITSITLTEPCPDLTTKREPVEAVEEIVKSKKNLFRMRQEVIVEDEGEDDTTNKARKRGKKKSLKKRATETPTSTEASEDRPVKRIKKKSTVAILQTCSDKSAKKKKRKSQNKNPDDETVKKTKLRSTKISGEENPLRIEKDESEKCNFSSTLVTKKTKKKKSDKQKVISLEKPTAALSGKRKLQNEISGIGTGFQMKSKKKKIAR